MDLIEKAIIDDILKRNIMVFTENIINKIKEFLGEDGISFFRGCKKNYGDISPVLEIAEGDKVMYWPVEWHEGRQIRNFIASFDEFKNEDIDTLEKLWRVLVEQII